jgi:5'-3' exoribonuclease 2
MSEEYLTENGIANLERVEMFLKSIDKEEKSIFRNRHERDEQEGGHGSDLYDTIRLWEEGWHERYYINKFNINQDNLKEFSIKVAQDYTRGLCWILQYYYQGVPSWDWYVFRIHLIISLFLLYVRYYPYHYGPFASDFSNLMKDVSVNFTENTQPFSPLEQMIATFPPQDAEYLPSQWRNLMLDKNSPIIDFYPTDFKIDFNGKREK